MVTVKQMRDALKKMPDDAPLYIEISAYYQEGARKSQDSVDLPVLDLGWVCIGNVYAQP
jgi:hypothetical protein